MTISAGDLGSLGKISESLIEAVRKAIGTLYRPQAILKEGKARAEVEAYRIIKIAEAKEKAKLISLGGFAADRSRLPAMRRNARDLSKSNDEADQRNRLAQRVIYVETKRQENLESILLLGLSEGEAAEKNGRRARPIDNDWMSAFIDCAQNISNAKIQRIWAKILASQATEGPPAVSRATLDAMRLLEPQGAQLFERIVRLFLLTGRIASTASVRELEFNIDGLDSLILVDIGLLRRVESRERAIQIGSKLMLFVNPELFDAKDICNCARKSDFAETTLKELRVDHCLLTGRGYELAAVLFPQFYSVLSGDLPSIEANIGVRRANAETIICREWAKNFAELNAIPCLASPKWHDTTSALGEVGRASELELESYYQKRLNRWTTLRKNG